MATGGIYYNYDLEMIMDEEYELMKIYTIGEDCEVEAIKETKRTSREQHGRMYLKKKKGRA